MNRVLNSLCGTESRRTERQADGLTAISLPRRASTRGSASASPFRPSTGISCPTKANARSRPVKRGIRQAVRGMAVRRCGHGERQSLGNCSRRHRHRALCRPGDATYVHQDWGHEYEQQYLLFFTAFRFPVRASSFMFASRAAANARSSNDRCRRCSFIETTRSSAESSSLSPVRTPERPRWLDRREGVCGHRAPCPGRARLADAVRWPTRRGIHNAQLTNRPNTFREQNGFSAF